MKLNMKLIFIYIYLSRLSVITFSYRFMNYFILQWVYLLKKKDGFFVNSSLMRFAVCKSDGVSDVLNIDHMLSDIWQNENLNFSHI